MSPELLARLSPRGRKVYDAMVAAGQKPVVACRVAQWL